MAVRTIESAIRNIHIMQEHDESNHARQVNVRLIFLRIGELNTQTEKYQAHVAIEARWKMISTEDLDKILSLEEQARLDRGETIKLSEDFSKTNWHPQLFLLNMTRDSKQEIKYTIKKCNEHIEFREFHDVYGTFHTKFDLHHFPTDIQELTISIGSALFDSEVRLEIDPNRASGINREAFADQQEWKLYDHINTKTRFIRGFLFQNDEDYELDTPGHERKRSILIISCHAARLADYFFWNGYFLIFLITIISFSSFAIPANGVQFRLAISCTLLLTSIAFRWTISNALPNISYLTVIDLYAILSIIVLIIVCAWHAIIGTFIFLNGEIQQLDPRSYWTRFDRRMFFALVGLYIVVQLSIGIWHYFVPIAQRRRLEELNKRYRKIVIEQVSNEKSSLEEKKDVWIV